ncbi:MAG: DEAD/DEAH box helicase [Bacteroidales bacterium]|nr:DEAD/DEAH box helicase [Bacteroidales bacterium]
MTITEQGKFYRIQFRYLPHLVDAVKSLPGRRFDPVDKCWTVPVDQKETVMAFAQKFKFSLGETMLDERIGEIPPMPELQIEIPLKMKLFHFQAQGVAYALEKKRIIVGDQPGLGKSCQAIATIVAANAFPCLVIAPSSLKINWQREWHMWSDRKAMILNDGIKNNFHLYWQANLAQVFIVNYESLKKYFVQSINKPESAKLRLNHVKFKEHVTSMFKSVIIDESHRVKSTATQQTKFTKGIASGKEYILALTGTPVINKPKDLISQLGIIEQMPRFGGYQKFTQRYCSGPREASNLRELNYLLNLNCFYRRDKQDVLKDLPAKMRQVAMCQITTRREYKDAEDNLIKYLRAYKDADDEKVARALRGEVMVQIGILKNISARGKLTDVYEFIDDIMESGEKLVVFAHLKEVIQAIHKHYPKAVTITGDDNQSDRQNAVDSFQKNPETKLILCSIKAAGVGLTLTASSRVAFVELPWTAADCDQCEDRCHRIGQHDSVTCTYFLGEDTIDEKIYKIIQTKREIAATVTGATEQIEEDIVSMVANLFNQRNDEENEIDSIVI